MRTKNIIAAALAVSLLCGASAQPVRYAGLSLITADAADITASGSCGRSLTWTLDSEGTLTVAGTGAMYDRNSNYTVPWAEYKDKITSVIVREGVTSIGGQAFESCTALTSVSLPSTLQRINTYAFSGCKELTSIVIPDGVTNIGSSSFAMCKKLSEISIPKSVTYIGDLAFASTKWLDQQRSAENPFVIVNGLLINGNLSSGDVAIPYGVTEICGNSFYYCQSMKTLTIPKSVVKIHDNAFNECSGLTSVTLPSSVKSIGMQAFVKCSGLKSVTILDPECEIFDRPTTFANDTKTYTGVIKGYDGSTAEKYAEKYGYTFVSLGAVPVTTTTTTTTTSAKTTSTSTKTTAASTSSTAPVPEKKYTLGDPTGDMKVDSKDATFVLNVYASEATGGKPDISAEVRYAADINSDKAIDSKDASYMLVYYSYRSTGGKLTVEEYFKK